MPQTLECSKTMIIAVSPVTDNSEQLDKDVDGESHHSNFLIKILMGEQGYRGHPVYKDLSRKDTGYVGIVS